MKKIEIFERFSKMKAIGEIENAMGIVSSRGVDRPYIRGVKNTAVARGEIDPYLGFLGTSTPVWVGGGVRGPWRPRSRS